MNLGGGGGNLGDVLGGLLSGGGSKSGGGSGFGGKGGGGFNMGDLAGKFIESEDCSNLYRSHRRIKRRWSFGRLWLRSKWWWLSKHWKFDWVRDII